MRKTAFEQLQVLRFMKAHENWKDLLVAAPYYLKISTDGEYTLLKYNQLNSDFHEEIVRECRGLIVDAQLNPVCIPFFKFGNYGESYCPQMDWDTIRVQEKIDGSLMKVWFDRGAWHISTNGTIDAHRASLPNAQEDPNAPFTTFGQLFDAAAAASGLDYDRLNPENTYIFELVSPYNQVVVPYRELALYHLGTRNNRTAQECEEDIGIQKPRSFPMRSLQDCIAAAAQLPYDAEGYVAVDGQYNRVKIKSPKYIAVAYTKNYADNPTFLTKRIIDIIRSNEIAEFLLYCPEHRAALEDIQARMRVLADRWQKKADVLATMTFASQKEFALYVRQDDAQVYLFEWRRSGISAEDFLRKQSCEKIAELIFGKG